MTATGGTAFAATVRVIHRVHRHAAIVRTLAHPALAAGLAQVLVLVVGVRHGAHGAHAVGAQVTLFAAVEAHDHHAAVTTDDLDVDALVVAEASVGKSVTMKRFATRGRGKSTRILKPFSRLRIVVREQEEEA